MRQGSRSKPVEPAAKHLLYWALVLLFGLVASAQTAAQDRAGEQLIRDSQWVFLGQVADQNSFRSPDGRFILTRYYFNIESTLKGERQAVAVVVEYGGTFGEETLYVSHTPRYRPGREYIVFAHLDSEGRWQTTGGSAGQLEVLRDPEQRRMVKLYQQHPLGSRLPLKPGIVPLESVLEELSTVLEGGREVQ